MDQTPEDWRPAVEVSEEAAIVSFFTFSALGQETLTRHVDRYPLGSYHPETETTELGTGAGGFVF